MPRIARGGYRVFVAKWNPYGGGRVQPEEEILTSGVSFGEVYEVTMYLEPPPGLFKDFAELKTTANVLRFANRHGDLGVRCVCPVHQEEETKQSVSIWGELISDWLREAGDMARAIEVWELVKFKRTRELRKLIQWSDDGTAISYTWRDGSSRLEVPISDMSMPSHYFGNVYLGAVEGLDRSDSNSLQNAARVLIQDWLNDHIWRNCCIIVQRRPDFGFEFRRISRSLLAAIWLQFAEEVSSEGEGKVKSCALCGEPFLAKRTSAKYCPGGACSQAAHRRRKKAARPVS